MLGLGRQPYPSFTVCHSKPSSIITNRQPT
nr:MAG TPA: hypothetical protein [Caudoviricetes sp.]